MNRLNNGLLNLKSVTQVCSELCTFTSIQALLEYRMPSEFGWFKAVQMVNGSVFEHHSKTEQSVIFDKQLAGWYYWSKHHYILASVRNNYKVDLLALNPWGKSLTVDLKSS